MRLMTASGFCVGYPVFSLPLGLTIVFGTVNTALLPKLSTAEYTVEITYGSASLPTFAQPRRSLPKFRIFEVNNSENTKLNEAEG